MSTPPRRHSAEYAHEALRATRTSLDRASSALIRLLASRAAQPHEQKPPMHPARAHIHETRSAGERAADVVARGLGSWTFLGVQTAVIVGWIAINAAAIVGRWDPYPFILLNLLFSTQAAYAAPILQLSGNRQSAKDRARDDQEAHEVEELYAINRQQLAILRQQDDMLALLHQALITQADTAEIPAVSNVVQMPDPATHKARRARSTRTGGRKRGDVNESE